MKITLTKPKPKFVFTFQKPKKKFVFVGTHGVTTDPKDTILGPYYEDAAWGVRIVTREQPRAWVKDCKTGLPMRKEMARCLGRGKDGHYYWIRIGEKIYIGQKTYASVWKENEIP